jgi:radical SAM superfamily enzyme YgiQ (UPF0313 family)
MAFVRLVNLSSLPILGNRPVYPVGVVSVAQALTDAGHEVEIVDFVARPEAVTNLDWLAEPCDLVGYSIRDVDPIDLSRFSFVGAFADFARRIAARTEAAGYRPLFVGGGTGFTLFPEELATRLGVDSVVTGEGEQALLELCADRIRGGSPRPRHAAADPGFPRRALGHPPEIVAAYLAAGRGEIGVETRRRKCLRKCQYCPYAFIKEGTLGEFRDLARLEQTINQLYGLGVRDLFFTDAVFNNELAMAKSVARLLAERAWPGLRWSAYFVPSGFDSELAELVAASGNRIVIFSPDSFDPRMLRATGKKYNLRQILAAKETCERAGLGSAWMLLFGSAHEDRDTIRRSAELANDQFGDHEIALHVGLRLLPGSPLVAQLGLSSADLLPPVFYPINPHTFDWVLEDFEPRFFRGEKMLRFEAMRRSLAGLQRLPHPNPIEPGLDYLLVQERQGRIAVPRH